MESMLRRWECFSQAIAGIYREMQRVENEEMTRCGLKGASAQYLTAIGRNPGITVSKLSEFCVKDKAAASRAVAELENKGMAERHGTGEGAYRAQLFLTEDGKKVLRHIRSRSHVIILQASQGVSGEHLRIFYETLNQINTNLRSIGGEADADAAALPKTEPKENA